jgi:two-component system cell cycle response regulator
MSTRVLVVDDTLEAIQLLSVMLQTNGFEPVTAMTPHKALRLAREGGISAALLDLLMPDVDGLELCRRLRADPDTANLAIIIVTAVNEPGVESRAREAGADGLIYKPIEMPDLIDSLNQNLTARGLI